MKTSSSIGLVVASGLSYWLTLSHAADLPSDGNRWSGDHIRVRVNVHEFRDVMATDTATGKRYCAPAGSRLVVNSETEDDLFVRFLSLTSDDDFAFSAADKAALDGCPDQNRVKLALGYKIAKGALARHDYTRTGVVFGGLVVPFKYRLGASKELVSSSTIAPFVGFRTGWLQSIGLTLTPVIAAGLSLVPVADPGGSTTSTKAAYTFALGIRLTSSKSDTFSAGLLYGRDFLNKADRDADPSVKEPWISIYLGYSL